MELWFLLFLVLSFRLHLSSQRIPESGKDSFEALKFSLVIKSTREVLQIVEVCRQVLELFKMF